MTATSDCDHDHDDEGRHLEPTESVDENGVTTVVTPNGDTYRIDPDGWIIPATADQARRFVKGALARVDELERDAAEHRGEADELDLEAKRHLRRAASLSATWDLNGKGRK